MTSFGWKTDTAVCSGSGPGPGRTRGGAFGAGRSCLWLLAALVALSGACSGGSPRPPAQPPPQTETSPDLAEPATSPTSGVAEPPVIPEPRAPAPRVIIEPADPEPEAKPTLAEAAQRERERRSRAGEPIAVITDANLQEHAIGLLTFMEEDEEEESGDSSSTDDAEPAGSGEGEEERGEEYWRARVRDLRQRWADAALEVPELEDRVAELRRRFYETDDAYYRDTRIKPAWDRAIDLIAQRRAEAEAYRLELQVALDEGRQAGALPGWLREGIELEPAPPEPERDIHEPGEPKIHEPGGGGGGL
jgi:hypothetical protein